MASADQSILAFGASHISLTVMSLSPGGLVLDHVVHQPLLTDPALKDRWLESLPPALDQLSLKGSLKSVSSVVLPGWAVLSKILKVARIEGEGQREVVRFEAESTMPNGLAGHDWNFSILRDDGFERDVLVQAVSSEFLSELLGLLENYGVRPSAVEAVLFCQLRAFEEQYGEEQGPSVILDIGSRSVSLLVAAPDEIPFIRTFNFGGGLITQALAKQLGKSFQEAERLKLEWVQHKGDTGNLEVLNQCSEGFVTRLVNEVQRSLALYRRQGQTGSPERILLSGGGSQLPGLADFLERKSGIACSFYDPFRAIVSGPSLATSQVVSVGYSHGSLHGMRFCQAF